MLYLARSASAHIRFVHPVIARSLDLDRFQSESLSKGISSGQFNLASRILALSSGEGSGTIAEAALSLRGESEALGAENGQLRRS